MNTKRLLVLQGVLLAGLGSVFFLPKHVEQPAAGVVLELPAFVGYWYGENQEVTQRERDVLGPETHFSRRRYENGLGGRVDISIVLSGEDMNTSIHRPERCLPAQGLSIAGSHQKTIDLGSSKLSVTRLHTTRPLPATDEHPAYTENDIYYYWFIGSTETTPSHLSREFIDIRDRILKGTVQRWAYITVRGTVTKGLESFGHSEDEVDKMLTELIKKIVPQIERPVVVNS